MDNNDKTKFAEIMMGVTDNFGGSISPEGMKIRFQVLSEYSIDQVARAGSWLLRNRTQTFPAIPTVKEFLDAIKLQAGPQISDKTKAQIQADEVLSKVKFEGRNGEADFEDPITQRLMTTRWRYQSWAASLMEVDVKWWVKEFVETYQAYAEQDKAQMQMIEGPNNFKALANASVRRIA